MYRQSLCSNFERKSSLGDNYSENGYASSIAEDSQGIKNCYARNGSIGDNDDDTESVISLMSCQSISPSVHQHPYQNRVISPPYTSQLRKSPNMGGNCLNMIPENTLRRNDFKRHSLSSLRKVQGGINARGSNTANFREPSINSRNSFARRSLINPRFNINRMSAIEEFARKTYSLCSD